MAGLARCEREAAEVAELMRQNVVRALERDGRLSELDTRAQELRSMGQAFSRTSRAVTRRQQRRGRRRWRMAAVGLAAFLLLLLLLLLTVGLVLWLPRAPAAVVTIAVTVPQTPPVGTQPQALPPTGRWGGFGDTLQ